jgi:hypothetical protein
MGLFLSAVPVNAFAAGVAKKVYECTYDGGRDASTWQPTGEMAVPPAGSAVCLRFNDDYRCSKVVDANGKELGQGMFCGLETQPDYPDVKAYEQ